MARVCKIWRGSAHDRGSADKYYGRGFAPHYYRGVDKIDAASMTQAELAAYRRGWEEETDSKRWD